jgi:cytochrome c oxidase subunit 2
MPFNDLPGGPAVNQLNLHPAGHQNCGRAALAALVHADHLHGDLHRCVLCDVLFHLEAPQVQGHKSANFHESVTVEIVWTIVPFIIVILMALPATKVLVAQKDTTNADLTIKATGYQWKWGYDYLKGEGEGIGFISTWTAATATMSDSGKVSQAPDNYLLKVDNPLVVPVGKKVRIITTANDVIHAFMVPAFGIKQDAIPGFVRDTWFRAEKIGDFYGQCAELCGKEHAYMPIHVKVVSAQDYRKWVEGEKKKAAAKLRRPQQGLDAGRHAQARRKGLRRQLRGLPPGQRQGRRPDQAAGRRAVVLDADKSQADCRCC